MKRLALSLLLLSLFAAGVPAAFGQSCATPPPTATPPPSYPTQVAGTQGGHLLAYWQLNETSGTTANDSSGNGRNGTYSGVTLNSTTFLDGSPAGHNDGINDFVNAYTVSLAGAFDGDEGTLLVWAKVDGAGVWGDGIARRLAFFRADGSNLINIFKSTASNRIDIQRIGSATSLTRTKTSFSPVGWFAVAVTWSLSGNSQITYVDGSQEGATQTGLAALINSLASTTTVIGAGNTTSGANPWHGSLANVAVWDIALSSGEVAALATVPAPYTPPATATVCPTYTPTPSPTWTPTYTPTPTNTPNLYHFWTLPAPIGTPLLDATGTATPAPGLDVVFVSDFNAGQVGISFLLAAIFFSLLIMWLVVLLMRRKAPKQPKPVITTNQSE
jgi:hypothetical protein